MVCARDELESRGLIAYEAPLYQVLSIREPVALHRDSAPTVIGEILAELSEGHSNTPIAHSRSLRSK